MQLDFLPGGALAVCGLARDVCVRATAEDAVELGFKTTMLWDLTQAFVAASNAAVRTSLERAGIAVIDSTALTA